MSEEILEYLNSNKNSNNKDIKINFNKMLSKLLLSIIFLLVSIILIKSNNSIKEFYDKEVFTDQVSFVKFNNLYNKYFGSIVDSYNIPDTKEVFSDSLNYDRVEDYLNGNMFIVSNNYIVPVLESGIIVYLGEKDNLGNTCIIQGVDGYDIWYSNINLDNLKLYDYVSKGSMLNSVIDNKLYLTIEKEDKFIKYEEYTS